MMNKAKTLLSCAVIVVYVIIFSKMMFPFVFESGFDAFFNQDFDGMKNNFTLSRFVQEPITDKGIFYFQFFNYPYGEFVYTADNTPLLALLLRYINHHIYPIAAHSHVIFNVLMLLNLLLTGILFYVLLSKWKINNLLAVLVSIAIPFVNAAFIKLGAGHYNLSLSSMLLVSILISGWYYSYAVQACKIMIGVIIMSVYTLFAFLIHGYYLPIIGGYFILFLLFWTISKFRVNKDYRLFAFWFLSLILIIGLSYSVLWCTDGYLSLRQGHAKGFNALDQKMLGHVLFSGFDYERFLFFIRPQSKYYLTENHNYFGVTLIYIIAILLVSGWLSMSIRQAIGQAWTYIFRDRWFKMVGLVSLLLFFISFGHSFVNQTVDFNIVFPIALSRLSWDIASIVSVISVVLLMTILLLVVIQIVRDIKHIPNYTKRDWRHFFFYTILNFFFWIILFSNKINVGNHDNFFSLFYYARGITRMIEHFRSISRFVWLPHLYFLLLGVLLVYFLMKNYGKLHRIIVYGFLVVTAIGQVISKAVLKQVNMPNAFAKEHKASFLFPNANQYEAIIPIPFYIIGSEDYNLTIDDRNDWSKWTYQFSYFNELPMMASKLSRTSPAHANQFLDLLLNANIPQGMSSLMTNKKPLLLAINESYLHNPSSAINMVPNDGSRPKAYEANVAQFQLHHKAKNISFVGRKGSVAFYAWHYYK